MIYKVKSFDDPTVTLRTTDSALFAFIENRVDRMDGDLINAIIFDWMNRVDMDSKQRKIGMVN